MRYIVTILFTYQREVNTSWYFAELYLLVFSTDEYLSSRPDGCLLHFCFTFVLVQ